LTRKALVVLIAGSIAWLVGVLAFGYYRAVQIRQGIVSDAIQELVECELRGRTDCRIDTQTTMRQLDIETGQVWIPVLFWAIVPISIVWAVVWPVRSAAAKHEERAA
jgi:hypothetical protein